MSRSITRRFRITGVVILTLILGTIAVATPLSTNVAAQGEASTNEPRNLVSNLGTSTYEVRTQQEYLVGNAPVDLYNRPSSVRFAHREMSVPFTTGGNDRGYYITSITLQLWSYPSATETNPVVEIFDDRSLYARELVGTLVTPNPIAMKRFPNEGPQNELFTFNAPPGSGIHVDPNTTYHIRVTDGVGDETTVSYFFWAVTESEDQVDFAATYGDDPSGWTIGDAINYRFLDTVTWYTDGWGRTARFSIQGTNVTDEHAVLLDGSETTGGQQRRLDIGEGGEATYMVWLNSAPAGDVTVTPSTALSGPITVDSSTLTFNATNYQMAQSVSVTALDDLDAIDEDAVIEHAVTGYSGVESADLRVSIHDNDTEGRFDIELYGNVNDSDTLVMNEGEEASFIITPEVLSPNAIHVLIESSNPNVTIGPSSVRWNPDSLQPKIVLVRSPRDNDGAPEFATITLSAMEPPLGTLYDLPNFQELQVYVNDLDALEFNTGVNGDLMTLDEGRTETVEFSLTSPITEPVTVTVEIDPRLDVTNSPVSVVIQPGDDSTMPRTMFFMAGTDADGISESGWIRFRLTGDVFGGEIVNGEASGGDVVTLRAAVEDADKEHLVTNLATNSNYEYVMTLAEGTESTFTARLNSQPSPAEDVTMTFTRTSGGPSVEFRSPGQTEWSESFVLTFTTDNWSIDQTISVRALQDAGTRNAEFEFRIEGNGADYTDVNNKLNVTVIDDDVAELIPSPPSINMIETHDPHDTAYTVRLRSQPIDDVTVTLSSNSNYVVPDTDLSTDGMQKTIVFTPENWNEIRRVNVYMYPDHDADDAIVVIKHRLAGTDYDDVTLNVEVNIDDQFDCPPER